MIDEAKIREIIKQAGLEIDSGSDEFDKTFSEIGLDSLDVFGLLSEIDITLGRSFSEEEFSKLSTLNDIIKILNKLP